VTLAPAIGGVIAAEASGPPVEASLWDAWSGPFQHHAAYANARSALAAILRRGATSRVWLPAYGCPSLLAGAIAGAGEVRFYPVGADLTFEAGGWTSQLAPRDAVVVIDFFGRPPDDAWRRERERRDDLLWIEDRAQALDAGAPFGNAVIYSPRKVVGVGDGGLVSADVAPPAPSAPADARLWAPEDARAADPDGHAPSLWRTSFQAREARMAVSDAAATRRTLDVLKATPLAPIAARRRANWRRLAAALPEYALWPLADPAFAPLAFPILTLDAATAVRALAQARIWAPRHWADPPGAAAEFPEAHWLAARCVSLPLDQRYGEAEMDRIATAVRSALRPAGPSSGSPPPARRSPRG
jgi:dTDP-4-amino-4,6-dideoxygalactose transaminase